MVAFTFKSTFMTAIEQNMELMKQELLRMNNNDIRFGYLLKLIRQSHELIKAETEAKVYRHTIHNISDFANSNSDTNYN